MSPDPRVQTAVDGPPNSPAWSAPGADPSSLSNQPARSGTRGCQSRGSRAIRASRGPRCSSSRQAVRSARSARNRVSSRGGAVGLPRPPAPMLLRPRSRPAPAEAGRYLGAALRAAQQRAPRGWPCARVPPRQPALVHHRRDAASTRDLPLTAGPRRAPGQARGRDLGYAASGARRRTRSSGPCTTVEREQESSRGDGLHGLLTPSARPLLTAGHRGGQTPRPPQGGRAT